MKTYMIGLIATLGSPLPVGLLGFPETAAIAPFVGLVVQCFWLWWTWRLRHDDGTWPLWVAVLVYMGIYARLAALEIFA